MTQFQARTILLFSALLLTALFAGCATDTGPATQPGSGEDGSVPAPSDETEARQTFQTAMQSLGGDDDANVTPPERFAFLFEMEGSEATEEGLGEMSFFIDTPRDILIMEMRGQAFQDDTPGGDGGGMGMGGMMGEGSLVMARYHKTTFFGSTESLAAFYNGSAEPVDGWDDLDDDLGPSGMDDGGDEDDQVFSDPMGFLEQVDDPPEDAEVTYEMTTYHGDRALEVHLAYENETEQVDLTAILLLDPPFEGADGPLPARMEVSFTDKTVTDEEGEMGQGTLLYAFTYADQADHDLIGPLSRVESLTFTDEAAMDDMFSFGSGSETSNTTESWTIQPASNTGTVPLDEVEARLTSQADPQEILLALPLEDGTIEDDRFRLTYTDTDADEHVSEGDTIQVEELSNQTTGYGLQLYDEETGLAVTPGIGLWAALGVLVLAAVAAGRRR